MSDINSWRVGLKIDEVSDPALAFDRQRYYWLGFQQLMQDQCRVEPWDSRIFSWLRNKDFPGSSRLWRERLKSRVPKNFKAPKNHVGRYHFVHDSGIEVKVVIDTADGPQVTDELARQWSDLYFKANMWSDRVYPEKVLPIVNGNGKLNAGHLRQLLEMRETEKPYDVVYWSKIWQVGDADRRAQTLEHNIRLFECLAEAEGNNSLKCILPERNMPGEYDDCKRRLDRCGVEHQVGWGDIKTVDFHRAYARGRISFLRPGDHLCISWKMIDFLALGTCVMYDGSPLPQWPLPLQEGLHWVDGHCGLDANYQRPAEDQYTGLVQRVNALVADSDHQSQVMAANRDYYQHHAAPERVARYVASRVNDYYKATAKGHSPIEAFQLVQA